MAGRYNHKFKQLIRLLHRECPPSLPIKVLTKNLYRQQLCGCCLAFLSKSGKINRFVLEIDSSLSQLTAIDTLLHEWAHALDQDLHGIAREPHRASWGKCYAKVWRVYSKHLTD